MQYVIKPMGQDYELVRIFDSMVYEDETNDAMSVGITATGDLNSKQTRGSVATKLILLCATHVMYSFNFIFII